MKNTPRSYWPQLVLPALVLGLCASLLVAQSPLEVKPSSYAPVGDLLAQVEHFVEQIEKDLANEEQYGEYQQDRVSKDANTLAVLALVLGMHDQDNALKPAASALVAASVHLAEEAADYQQARAALAELKKTLQEKPQGQPVQWEEVADLQQLMKQVPIVNNSLRRGVTGRRFDRLTDQSAGQAATLAAIAQASMVDLLYCVDEEDEEKWVKVCADMRDSAAEVNRAVRQGDQKKAETALAKLVTTCDACHDDFR